MDDDISPRRAQHLGFPLREGCGMIKSTPVAGLLFWSREVQKMIAIR